MQYELWAIVLFFFAKVILSSNMSMNHLRIVAYVHLHKKHFELFLVTHGSIFCESWI